MMQNRPYANVNSLDLLQLAWMEAIALAKMLRTNILICTAEN